MWICEKCGQPLDDQAKKCSMCGVERPKQVTKATQAGKASRTFEFGEDKKTPEIIPEPAVKVDKPVQAGEAEKPAIEGAAQPKPNERLILTILKQLIRTPRFWIVSGAVVLSFVVLPWSCSQLVKVLSVKPIERTKDVEPEVRKTFEVIIDDLLPDKLEWGREVLTHRIPTRFPEELTLDINKRKAEVKYNNSQRTSAYYRLLISYHFVGAHELTYLWQPVTFSFEIRNGNWTMIGDRWLRESELEFE